MKYFILLLLSSTFVFSQIGKLKVERVQVGDKVIKVEIARTPQEMSKGLMFRKSLGQDEGMLFIYDNEGIRNFWMKNTFIPLSIGFFNKNRELIDVQEMTPVTSEMQANVPTYESAGPAMYALEMPEGWFKKYGFTKNKKVRLKIEEQ